MEEKIRKYKKEKSWGVSLICRPVYVLLLGIIARLVFWLITKINGINEVINTASHFVNWIFGLLLLLYIFALPVGIVLTVDGSNELKKIKKVTANGENNN